MNQSRLSPGWKWSLILSENETSESISFCSRAVLIYWVMMVVSSLPIEIKDWSPYLGTFALIWDLTLLAKPRKTELKSFLACLSSSTSWSSTTVFGKAFLENGFFLKFFKKSNSVCFLVSIFLKAKVISKSLNGSKSAFGFWHYIFSNCSLLWTKPYWERYWASIWWILTFSSFYFSTWSRICYKVSSCWFLIIL